MQLNLFDSLATQRNEQSVSFMASLERLMGSRRESLIHSPFWRLLSRLTASTPESRTLAINYTPFSLLFREEARKSFLHRSPPFGMINSPLLSPAVQTWKSFCRPRKKKRKVVAIISCDWSKRGRREREVEAGVDNLLGRVDSGVHLGRTKVDDSWKLSWSFQSFHKFIFHLKIENFWLIFSSSSPPLLILLQFSSINFSSFPPRLLLDCCDQNFVRNFQVSSPSSAFVPVKHSCK